MANDVSARKSVIFTKAAKTIEEKLSDKRQLLIERFIDRRTTVLLKTIRKEES